MRALERALVEERAEIHAGRVVDYMLRQWDDAAKTDFHRFELDFLHEINRCGLDVFRYRAASYLERCHYNSETPDRSDLLRILVPWYS